MASTGTVIVKGLPELNRAFRKMSGGLDKELKAELKKAADPVKVRAESLALSRIRNMPRSPHWADMRVGVSARAVYMVPRARARGRKGGSRPNLKSLLLDKAMEPALEEKENEVVQGVGQMIDRMADSAGF